MIGVGIVNEADMSDIAKAEAQMVADLTHRTLMTPLRLDPIEERKFAEKIEKHRNWLTLIITELGDLQVFSPAASELRRWFAWPTESSLQVSQGQAYLVGGGKVLVTLNLQEQEVWKLVRQFTRPALVVHTVRRLLDSRLAWRFSPRYLSAPPFG